MSGRKLKNIVVPAVAEMPVPASPARLTSDVLREITERADPTQPPAVMPTKQSSTLITLRIQTSLADAIADAARGEGTTQKVIITRALAAAGFQVSRTDLEDRTPRRRR